MNWGHGILITIIIFVLSILTMVFVSSYQTIDMMDDQYYKKELKHQELIDKSDNSAKADGHIDIEDKGEVLLLNISNSITDSISSGDIIFMRLSDKKLDVRFPLEVKEGKQIIDKSTLFKGVYQVRMSWINNGIPYYQTFKYNVT